MLISTLYVLGGSCDNVFCGVGRECVEGLAKEPVCDCIERCYEPPNPICASDDVTYDNECEMHRAACSAGTVLRKIADGSCKKGIFIKLFQSDADRFDSSSFVVSKRIEFHYFLHCLQGSLALGNVTLICPLLKFSI